MSFLRLPFTIIACGVLVLFICRALLWLSYPDYFSVLSYNELLVAFLQGIRFDLSVLVISLSPLLLLLLIPSRKIHNRTLLPVLAWLSLFIMLAVVAVTLADISYFSEVKRHMGAEIGRLQEDFGVVLEVALSSRLTETLLGLMFMLLITLLWYRVVILSVVRNSVILDVKYWRRSVGVVAGFFVLLLMGRGLVLQSKPLGMVDAFSQGGQVQANLTLNGAFVAFKENDSRNNASISYLDEASFRALAPRLGGDRAFEQQTYPRQVPKNVVFVLLESWSYKYVDGLAGGSYRVTPFIDQLVEQSLVWDRFYAAGQRSILGIQAVLSSVPVLQTQPVLGWGLELNSMSRLAVEAEREGYRTLMVQSSNRRSFHMDGIAKSLGFSEYYGKEDMPVLRGYPQDVPRFGWDYEALMYTYARIKADYRKEQPFFAFVFTGTTHEPYADPGAEFHVYPHSDADEKGFLNTMRYADWSLEQFMAAAAQEPWYKDTVFIFTADHVLKADTTELEPLFHIPLMMYAPDGSLPVKRRQDIASQYDLLPTLLELMGVETRVSTFGRSLWREGGKESAYVSQGSVGGLIAPGIAISFTDKQALTAEKGITPVQRTELQWLQWRLQQADRLLQQNRWAIPEKASLAVQ